VGPGRRRDEPSGLVDGPGRQRIYDQLAEGDVEARASAAIGSDSRVDERLEGRPRDACRVRAARRAAEFPRRGLLQVERLTWLADPLTACLGQPGCPQRIEGHLEISSTAHEATAVDASRITAARRDAWRRFRRRDRRASARQLVSGQ
jgi:hypothetical protein